MRNNLIYRRVFVGSASQVLATSDFEQLVDELDMLNKTAGMTGLLFYCGGNFVCVAEGDEADVCNSLSSHLNSFGLKEQLLLKSSAVEVKVFDKWTTADCKNIKAELISDEDVRRDTTKVIGAAKSIIENMMQRA